MTTHVLAALAACCALGQLALFGSGVRRLGPRLQAEAAARVTRP